MQNTGERGERVITIVAEALKRPASERDAYVRTVCGGDEDLYRDVAEAVAWEERMGNFLREPVLTPGEGSGESSAEPPEIGPYRLRQKIGEGGMAEVWLADQTAPVRRRVALKLIKSGMDTGAMITRFESERQALALMDHDAIARVFDAGSTAQGRPFFVMEYVAGTPITDYCDTHRLTLRQRLELFIRVCEGVQHAHQKAIIHRDLKPSNVLVTAEDRKAVPKIIDFGIAKAIGQRLTERTLLTETGVLVGTPEYMSPEQADLTGHNVDTRTDVYALGLILYELLAGAPPFGSKELRKMGIAEMLRAIREVDPPRPSTRVRTLGSDAKAAAGQRNTDPRALERQLRGDLDWIAVKALEKDRARRYASPSDLAADIGRYLRTEPVVARPPGALYRAQKFARRHRFGVGVAAGLVLLLLGFAITMAVEARRIAEERDRANRAAAVSLGVKDFMTGLFQVSNPSEARGNSITAREILDRGATRIDSELRDHPALQAEMMQTIGTVYKSLGLYGQAEPLLKRAIATQSRVLGPEHSETLSSMSSLGELYRKQSRCREGETLDRQVLEVLRRRSGPDRPETLQAMVNLGRDLGELNGEESAAILKDAVDRARRSLGADHQITIQAIGSLARAYGILHRVVEAEPLFREFVAGRQRTLGPEHPDTLNSMTDLALNLIFEKQFQEADELLTAALAMQRRVLPPGHRDMLYTLNDLGWSYIAQHRRYREAERLLREALSIGNRSLDANSIHVCGIRRNLADAMVLQGNFVYLQRAMANDAACLTFDWLDTDEDLKALRGDPRFKSLLAKARKSAK